METNRGTARLLGGHIQIRRPLPALILTGLSLLMTCLIFPRPGWWPLAYVCLVPWLIVVCTVERARFVYVISYLFGAGFFLINIRWMRPVTWEGYTALCVFYALSFPIAAWPIRHMYRRRSISVALTAPIVWVAIEYIRSSSALGFPWLILGHSQYRQLTLIQISDLVGAYGVSFMLVMVNGWITDLLIQPILIWREERPAKATRLPIGSLTTAFVVLGTLIYGAAQGESMRTEGPKVAVVQGDFTMYVDQALNERTPAWSIFQTYLELTRQAAAEHPDLIVLPETAWGGYANDSFLNGTPEQLEDIRNRRFPRSSVAALDAWRRESRQQVDALQRISTESGASIVFGSMSLEPRPTGIPPRVDAFNSSFLMRPGGTMPVDRYDKIHLVLFGEYVPFRYTYRSIYQWLNSHMPWGAGGFEYSLTAGDRFNAFDIDAPSRGRRFRAGTPICYEEIMPYIARGFTRGESGSATGKNIDMLLSISNDGWFYHTGELEQHLSAAVFRAVENRIAIARSVNTGTSALVDPNGRIHHRVLLSEKKREGMKAVRTFLEGTRPSVQAIADRNVAPGPLSEADARDLTAFTQRMGAELAPALTNVGAEFRVILERLDHLVRTVAEVQPKFRRIALDTLLGQMDDDLDSIQRWLEKPWTGPGYSVGELRCDNRLTVYTRWGDWFSQGAALLTGLMILDWFVQRVRRRPGVAAAPAVH